MTANIDQPLNRLEDNTGRRPAIVSVLSGKGGVGKTVVSYNLAHVAARNGMKTLVVDADWNFGNLHILGNVSAEITLADTAYGAVSLSEAVIVISDNVHLLASPAAREIDREFDREVVSRWFAGFREAAGQYDLIVIDTSTGVLELVVDVAAVSDFSLLVSVPELTSIADTYGLFKYLTGKIGEIEAGVVVNRTETPNDGEYIISRLSLLTEKFLGRPLSGGVYLPDTRQVRQSIEMQKPVLMTAPDSDISWGFCGLYKLLCQNALVGQAESSNISRANINEETIEADIKE
jgi:flagellar biosynthesis protein FlhG